MSAYERSTVVGVGSRPRNELVSSMSGEEIENLLCTFGDIRNIGRVLSAHNTLHVLVEFETCDSAMDAIDAKLIKAANDAVFNIYRPPHTILNKYFQTHRTNSYNNGVESNPGQRSEQFATSSSTSSIPLYNPLDFSGRFVSPTFPSPHGGPSPLVNPPSLAGPSHFHNPPSPPAPAPPAPRRSSKPSLQRPPYNDIDNGCTSDCKDFYYEILRREETALQKVSKLQSEVENLKRQLETASTQHRRFETLSINLGSKLEEADDRMRNLQKTEALTRGELERCRLSLNKVAKERDESVLSVGILTQALEEFQRQNQNLEQAHKEGVNLLAERMESSSSKEVRLADQLEEKQRLVNELEGVVAEQRARLVQTEGLLEELNQSKAQESLERKLEKKVKKVEKLKAALVEEEEKRAGLELDLKAYKMKEALAPELYQALDLIYQSVAFESAERQPPEKQRTKKRKIGAIESLLQVPLP